MKNVVVEHNHPRMQDMLSLEGKGVVVTGGARGIGAEIALRLSEAGAEIMILDIDSRQAEHAAREIEAESGNHLYSGHVDVSDPEDVFKAAEHSAELLPQIDVWINNAGVFPVENPAEVSANDFARVIDVNLIGSQIGSEAAIFEMRKHKKGGVIVNVASSEGFHPAGSYAAAKRGIAGLTEGLAGYLGKEGIRVVCVAPTAMRTPGLEQMPREEVLRSHRMMRSLPLGEGRPDDVARAVHFLVSPAASWITGVTLPVDGGESVAPHQFGNGVH